MRSSRRIGVLAAAVAAVAAAGIAVWFISANSSTYTFTARIDTYSRTEDPQQIALRVEMWESSQIIEQSVDENDREVRITVRARQDGNVAAQGTLRLVTLTLRAPLGSRIVIDGSTGAPVPGGTSTPSPP